MNKINYQKYLDKIISELELTGDSKKKSLLLHSCCAPCSSYVLEYLSKFFDITVFYYNPNISPKAEYEKRVEEQQKFINAINDPENPIKFLEGDYNTEAFLSMSKGLEHIPEGGERCFKCYRLRLEETAKIAKQLGFDYFTTTLSISPHKNEQILNQIGEELESIYAIAHLPADFKKKNGYKRSIVLSREHDLYRQDYCGCAFSRNTRNNTI